METSAIQSMKLMVGAMFTLSKDALHIYVGLFVFLTVCFLVRKNYRALWPLLAVLVVACLGEIFDARDNLADLGRWRWRASLHDIVNTMFWPVVLSILIRLRVLPLSDESARRP